MVVTDESFVLPDAATVNTASSAIQSTMIETAGRRIYLTTPTNLAAIATVDWHGMKTAAPLPGGSSTTCYFQIEALDTRGAVRAQRALAQESVPRGRYALCRWSSN
jgi:hypothetical protein